MVRLSQPFRAVSDAAPLLVAFALLFGLTTATPAQAHRESTGGPTSGLVIPSLSHGEMLVVSAYRGKVITLADAQFETDPTFRKLRNFVALQHTFCLWGLMPGSIADEASPFNECAHADLAAVHALLLHMTDMPAAEAAARSLEANIDRAFKAEASTPVLCQYSEEPFNTADMIEPHWAEIPHHAPTLLVCLAALAFLLSGIMALWVGARSPHAA